MNRYDAIIIGTGQAGPSLAERLARAGMRVAIIERGRFGGTCVNNGCTPTKTLIASAYAAHLAVQRGVRLHPTVSELIPTVLEALSYPNPRTERSRASDPA
jgi:pyruvate/2-oxoglutarate dehydrogenase complex dihydrolipoamide dehydrogenase (E3) component